MLSVILILIFIFIFWLLLLVCLFFFGLVCEDFFGGGGIDVVGDGFFVCIVLFWVLVGDVVVVCDVLLFLIGFEFCDILVGLIDDRVNGILLNFLLEVLRLN